MWISIDEWMVVGTVLYCYEQEIKDDCTIPLMNGEGQRRGFVRFLQVWSAGQDWFVCSDGLRWQSGDRNNWSPGVTGQVFRFNYTCTSIKNLLLNSMKGYFTHKQISNNLIMLFQICRLKQNTKLK